MQEQRIPEGLCQCGCGGLAPLSDRNDATRNRVKGHPLRFIAGHSSRRKGPEYIEQDRGYETACWIWTGIKDANGYGRLRTTKATLSAHRLYYTRARGEIPADRQLDHLCRVRDCVNPDHLEVVSCAENQRRGANAKLTLADAHQIRLIWATTTGVSSYAIADLFGVSRPLVNGICRGQAWRYEHLA